MREQVVVELVYQRDKRGKSMGGLRVNYKWLRGVLARKYGVTNDAGK